MKRCVREFESIYGRSNNVRRFVNYLKAGQSWDASGILLLENYYLPNSQTWIPCLVVFGQNKKKDFVYEEAGGEKGQHEKPWITASRELKEESFNLFRLNKHKMKHCPFVQVEGYVCYSVFIKCKKPILSKYYYQNKSLINKLHKQNHNVPFEWRETKNMTRIPLSNFMNSKFEPKSILKQKGNIYVKDVYNKLIPLSTRCKKCILKSIKQKSILKAPTFTLTFEPHFHYHNNAYYLEDTKTYFN